MELTVQIAELQKKKLFVAAPMYGGQCAGMFCKSTNEFGVGHDMKPIFAKNLTNF